MTIKHTRTLLVSFRAVLVGALATVVGVSTFTGCGASDDRDVVGPFTGEVRRYVVDDLLLPNSTAGASAISANLDGDDVPDNQFYGVLGMLRNGDNLNGHVRDIIAAGPGGAIVELQSDDLDNDATVGVRYVGTDAAAGDVVVVGGSFVAGSFMSNRTAWTQVPGRTIVRLPIFIDADPSRLSLEGMELELTPDQTGGGYTMTVRGGITESSVRAAALLGSQQMLAADPGGHRFYASVSDVDLNGTFTQAEFDRSTLLNAVIAPDLELSRGPTISFAYQVHLRPCPAGNCAAAIVDTCGDRILDGDETDVDCGGSCRACPGGATCETVDDCQTAACSNETCAEATCTDGVRDGYESDVDCGGACATCRLGSACVFATDCTSNVCSNSVCAAS